LIFMAKTVCIICGKEKNGLPVKDDYVIRALRWIKTYVTKNSKNYNLVVCKEDFLAYKKKRDSFERKLIIYGAIGIIFTIAIFIGSAGRPSAILVGLVITLGLLALAHVNYMPAVVMPKITQPPKKRKKQS
jgi:hypothetical protein